MTPSSRRRFVGRIALAAGSLGLASRGFAQAGAHVDEADPAALALGYRNDTTKVDDRKYPKHAATQRCADCSFWQGKADDPWAGCAMFGRKQVAHDAWCTVWAKVPGA